MNKKNSNKKKTQLLMHNAFHTNCFSVSLKKKTKKKKNRRKRNEKQSKKKKKKRKKIIIVSHLLFLIFIYDRHDKHTDYN